MWYHHFLLAADVPFIDGTSQIWFYFVFNVEWRAAFTEGSGAFDVELKKKCVGWFMICDVSYFFPNKNSAL